MNDVQWMTVNVVTFAKAHRFENNACGIPALWLQSCVTVYWHEDRLTPYTGPNSGKCLHCLRKMKLNNEE
ncbi:hypothetical protein LCGC14_0412100 [marine sediment metagenome]|uniref:Uncharacterized protein n=1 Tax=marine sediment metagenome TaxID=412755 RepID=A0A0F9SZA1_9ZZZZ